MRLLWLHDRWRRERSCLGPYLVIAYVRNGAFKCPLHWILYFKDTSIVFTDTLRFKFTTPLSNKNKKKKKKKMEKSGILQSAENY